MSTSHRSICAATFCLAVVAVLTGTAHANDKQREVALGLAPHLLFSTGESSTRNADVVDHSSGMAFFGADLSLHWWPIDFLGVGLRVSGSKDMDMSEGTSSGGYSWDPEDQWLWRLSAEARLDPPILPSGIWIGAEIGLALLREVQEDLSAS
jgi:opacity protein-like surface antigen